MPNEAIEDALARVYALLLAESENEIGDTPELQQMEASPIQHESRIDISKTTATA